MSFFRDSVDRAASGLGSNYVLNKAYGYVSGEDSRKSPIWAVLTVIFAIGGYMTGMVPGDIAGIYISNSFSAFFLWLRERKVQQNVLGVHESLSYNTQLTEQSIQHSQSAAQAALVLQEQQEHYHRQLSEQVARHMSDLSDQLTAQIDERFKELGNK